MKYILFSSIICFNAFCSDNAHQAYQQLHTIICAGAINDFQNNKANFEAHLSREHIVLAQRSCARRLRTIIDLQTKGFTDNIGIIVTDFIERYCTEPNSDQFLAREKQNTMLLANALQRLLNTKDEEDARGLTGLECCAPER